MVEGHSHAPPCLLEVVVGLWFQAAAVESAVEVSWAKALLVVGRVFVGSLHQPPQDASVPQRQQWLQLLLSLLLVVL